MNMFGQVSSNDHQMSVARGVRPMSSIQRGGGRSYVSYLGGGDTHVSMQWLYRSGTVNSKSFVGKVLLRIKWKFELINAL